VLKLTADQYIEATDRLAKALERAEDAGMRTHMGRAGVMLEALGNDFDVSAMDPGPPDDLCQNPAHGADHRLAIRSDCMSWREDITSGNVAGCSRCGAEDHDTEDHDAKLMERIKGEINEYNSGLRWGSVGRWA
jgi:hypothetical protein